MTAFGIILALLGALFGGMMAGDRCYNLDMARFQRTQIRNPNYMALLNKYEITGAVIGAMPGVILSIG